MPLKVLNWNVGGAKFLETEDENEREDFRKELNSSLRALVKQHKKPHVIALQEIVHYAKPRTPRKNLIDPLKDYVYHPLILIDTLRHPYVRKWKNLVNWPKGSYFGQGNAILWRRDLLHYPVFRVPGTHIAPTDKRHVENVLLMSGLYFGDRNTEPRAAMVAHFVFGKNSDTRKKTEFEKPLDVFVVNVHLTTLMGEREGVPQIDHEASRTRLGQLHIVLNGIVSRYNNWRRGRYHFADSSGVLKPDEDEDFERHSPIWILCGDFNFIPESEEYQLIKRMNFVDGNPQKGTGTKGSGFGSKATITCDYIFAGLKFTSLDPLVIDEFIDANPKPDYDITVSDHYPLFAKIPLTTLG
jgi:endonuclease/exonuclease/phosphatase family metal-dependent hydrolase